MCWLWCFILRGPDGNFMLYNTWKHSPGIHIRHQSKYPSDVDAKKFKQVPTFDIPFCETTIKSELYVIRHDQQLSWVFNDTVERHFHSRHNFQSISRLICLQTAKRVARIINTSRSCFFCLFTSWLCLWAHREVFKPCLTGKLRHHKKGDNHNFYEHSALAALPVCAAVFGRKSRVSLSLYFIVLLIIGTWAIHGSRILCNFNLECSFFGTRNKKDCECVKG